MDQGHRVHDQGRPGLHAGPPGVHPAVGHDGPLRARQHHARQDQDGGGDQRQPARPLLPREHAEIRKRRPDRQDDRRHGGSPLRPDHQRAGRARAERPGDGVADGGRWALRHPERHRGDRLPRHLQRRRQGQLPHPHGAAARLLHPAGRPGRADGHVAEAARHAARAHPLPDQRAGLPRAGDGALSRRRRAPRRRRGVRRLGRSRRARQGRRCGVSDQGAAEHPLRFQPRARDRGRPARRPRRRRSGRGDGVQRQGHQALRRAAPGDGALPRRRPRRRASSAACSAAAEGACRSSSPPTTTPASARRRSRRCCGPMPRGTCRATATTRGRSGHARACASCSRPTRRSSSCSTARQPTRWPWRSCASPIMR